MKTKFSTRILALALMLAMLASMMVFTVSAEDKIITFELGANGEASHYDGTSATTCSETVDGYTLNITGGTKMYKGARDAQGNGCIKFGTSSAVGSCNFTVPDDVTSVVINVAKYKKNTTKISVNGTQYTLTKNSNDGEYDAITVDTGTTKTVNFATVSGGVRAMINSIQFVISGGADSNEPFISLTGDSVLQVGNTVELTATLTNLTGNVEWSSDAEGVATVADGVVTGVSMGTAKITASVGDVKQVKEVTVYPASDEPITIAEALAIIDFAGGNETPYNYTVIGTVESTKTESDSRISATITDDTGSIFAYKIADCESLTVGQTIKVTGTLKDYNGTSEIMYPAYEPVLNGFDEAILEELHKLTFATSLAYSYDASRETVTRPAYTAVADTLNNAFTVNSTSTTYSGWSGKTGASGAVYAGNSAGGNSAIQMRTTNSNSGIVSTISGGKIKSIKITFNANTTAGRELCVYGSNTAYAAATDLYGNAQGTLAATFTYDKTVATQVQTFVFEDDYAYIGIRSKSGALYIDAIEIEWECQNGTTEVEGTICENSYFALRFGVAKDLETIGDVDSYGLVISAGGKDVYFSSTEAKTWNTDGDFCYITLGLGDIINDKAKLTTEFTVKAYIVVGENTYISNGSKTCSVVDMVKTYSGLEIPEVDHLYGYLEEIGLI